MKQLTKGILSVFLVLTLLITALPVAASGQKGSLELQITPSVSKAAVGDVIEYTVTASGSNVLAMEFKLAFPEGLSYVADSGAIPKGLDERLGWAAVDWTEESGKWTGYNDSGVEIPAGTVILTFCAVAEAEGDYQVDLVNLWPYDGNLQDIAATVKADSVQIVKQAPVKVTGLTASDVEEKSFTVHWDGVDGAEKYWIYLNGVAYSSTKDCSITISNRKPDTAYEVKVIACWKDGTTQALKAAEALNVRTQAQKIAFSGTAGETGVVLTWDATGCEKTWIYIGLSADTMKPMYGSTTDTFTVTGLEPNTTYYFQLAHSKSGNFVMGDTVLTVKTLTPKYPEKVTGLKSSDVEQNGFTVTWDAADGAEKYWIYLNGVAYSSTKDCSITISNRKPDTAYEVKVIACWKDGPTQALKAAEALSVRTQAQKIAFSGTAGETSVVLTWDATGCEKTWIYMGLSADTMKPMYGSTTDTFTVTGLEPNTTYYFQLAHSKSGNFVMGDTVLTVKTLTPKYPEKVTGLKSSDVEQNGFTVTWDAADGAEKYWIYLNGVAYSSTKDCSITISNRKPGTTYEVKVIACWKDGTTQALKNAEGLTVITLG